MIKNYLKFRYTHQIETIEKAYNLFYTYQKIFEKFLKTKIKGNVLDAGSGAKSFFNVLQKEGLNAYEIDYPEVDFEKDKFPFEDNFFDFIFANAVIEHLSDPSNFLSEVHRVLKNNGFFLITTPNWQTSYRIFYRDPTHKKPYDPVGLKTICEMFDFKVLFLEPHFINKPLFLFKLPFRWKLSFITKSMIAICQKN